MGEKLKFIAEPKTVSIVGCPFRIGVDKGPIHLVNAGLVEQLKDLGWVVEFDGHHQFEDISAAVDPPTGKLRNPRLVSNVTEAVGRVVAGCASKGSLPLTLGGDHSLAMGTIAGTLSQVVTESGTVILLTDGCGVGNIHGMPLAFLTSVSGSTSLGGFASSQPIPFSWLDSVHLPPSNLAYIGLRDVDQGEKAIIREHNIAAFSMHEVDRYGIGKVSRNGPIHLSFDVDALDPSVAPSTGTPGKRWLTFREGHYICERLYETGLLVAVDLMEEADAQQTVAVGCSLVRAALGETLL
ncbi:arginase [Lactarius pseudohatsudake]|nr:arginase [Lactarius pseudohatsudake]